MVTEDDFIVASLAKLVGSELNVIDHHTEGHRKGANRLDPKSFLNQKNLRPRNTPAVIKHEGMSFYAGADEAMVQSMYPDPNQIQHNSAPPVTAVSAPAVAPPVHVQPATQLLQAAAIPSQNNAEFNDNLLKILKSIDKTLKSIDKTEKTLAEILNNQRTISGD